MGDYLSELAAKNIGTADIVRPRRAARFEPVQTPHSRKAQDFAFLFREEDFDLEQAIEENRAGEINPDARPRRLRRTRLNKKDELLSNRDDSDEPIPQTRFAVPPETQAPITKRIDEPVFTRSEIIETPPEAPNEILSPGQVPSPTIIKPKKTLPAPAAAPDQTAVTTERAAIQPLLAEKEKSFETKIPVTKNSERQIVEKESAEKQSPIVAKPQISRFENHFEEAANIQTRMPREQSSKQISESAEMPETPVINVTIGRVEVRAVTSSAAIKEPRPKPPMLSLDEYLRQRSRGGGR